MGYVTPEQIAQAKEWDLLTYLQRYDPHQLVHVGGSTYCTREHDSGSWSSPKPAGALPILSAIFMGGASTTM